MNLDPNSIGATIRARRTEAGLTQAELAERLNVSAQSVSHWERGETLPDISTLPDLACILGCSVDMLLGGPAGRFRRRITVGDMQQAIGCIRRLRELLGANHFIYRTMADALDERMNSRIEPAFADERAMDAYVCEALLECIAQGDWADVSDVRRHIHNEKARDYTLQRMAENGLR
ncbi:MAG: helix-turn-helix transcriptional regulator [Clostridia bacterium]|nr:helix-turn-helix transcriptional regulator [Clostridia bacterium]